MSQASQGTVIAEGVDDEPVESNRRNFAGWLSGVVAALAFVYAAFHMAALNGLSISGMIAAPASIEATFYERTADRAFEDVLDALGPLADGFDSTSLRRLSALVEETVNEQADPASVAARMEELDAATAIARDARNEARAIKRAWAERLPFLPALPLETWNFRIVHIAGALALGFILFSARLDFPPPARIVPTWPRAVSLLMAVPAALALWTALGFVGFLNSGDAAEIGGVVVWMSVPEGNERLDTFPAYAGLFEAEVFRFGIPLLIATFGSILLSWIERRERGQISIPDLVLAVCGAVVAIYLVTVYSTAARNSVGTPEVPIGIAFAATAGAAMILELTRRVAGLALVVITGIFLAYTFTAHVLPGVLSVDNPYTWQRFFGHVYSDAGILGPTTAVSSTYIILFITFAAFLQASKVGDYFVNFAFAAAGRARGGPAKVAIFASGLMGMINGTSAGNVVATGSLTIPLMKKVGYNKRSSGAIEAAASTGGQIMPPIMGAGAFIMAEITGIPYQEIAIAAIIPAVLYFASIYFMVDFEAAREGMRGMREDELPKFSAMARQVYLFIPIIILIYALFQGYSVIRAGTLATVSAVVVSWLTPHWMGLRSIAKAFQIAGVMSIQIIAVCACAGIIVGVISLTGVGQRFSALLLDFAGNSQLLALVFAMLIAILLGMGMPTTAAYAVAASVVAPGLRQVLEQGGLPPDTAVIVAHFFVFYYAVVSAITPPVALASYAAAGISGANAMETSVASFRIGIAAFIVPFMFVYNGALLMEAPFLDIVRAGITAMVGVFLLTAGVQGWFFGGRAAWYLRVALIAAALFMISGGWLTDLMGIGIGAAVFAIQRVFKPSLNVAIPIRGAD